MKISPFLWFFPFLCFISGYWLMQRHFISPTAPTPSLIGLSLTQALELLASHHLNARIIDYQEHDDVPAATIIAQQPSAGQPIKIHCPLLITVTKKPLATKAPEMIGLCKIDLEKIAKKNNSVLITHHLEHATPAGYCFAQLPAPGQILEKNTLICFITAEPSKTRLMPDCTATSPIILNEFFATTNIQPEFCTNPQHHAPPYCSRCIVLDQQPRAGTIITIDQKSKIKFLVGH